MDIPTLAQVIGQMRQIDTVLPPDDGVAAFNRVYLRVTERVAAALADGRFADTVAMDRLTRVFAELYLDNVAADLAGGRVSPPWRPLFEARDEVGVEPFQHVLAGMSAHILHDLPLAVVASCRASGHVPDDLREDYLRVNDVLVAAEAELRARLEPWLLRLATHELERAKHLLSAFTITRGRELAWRTTLALWPQRALPTLYGRSVATLAAVVEHSGRALMPPLPAPGLPGLAAPELPALRQAATV